MFCVCVMKFLVTNDIEWVVKEKKWGIDVIFKLKIVFIIYLGFFAAFFNTLKSI